MVPAGRKTCGRARKTCQQRIYKIIEKVEDFTKGFEGCSLKVESSKDLVVG